MNFDEIINKRTSVRDFQDKKVERDIIYSIIEAARLAPSASNVQPWRFICVDEKNLLSEIKNQALGGIVPNRWIKNCPVIIVICAKTDIITNFIGAKIKDLPYYLIDCGISGEHLVLKATELGLGTCWVGWFSEKKIKEILLIPKYIKIVSLIALGYPQLTENKNLTKRRLSIENILFFNSWK